MLTVQRTITETVPKLIVEYDTDAENPTDWGNFTIVQFRDRDEINYVNIDDYLTENGKLLPKWHAKINAGKAFVFRYYNYGNSYPSEYKYPTNHVPTGELWGHRDFDGLIIFDGAYIKGVSYDDRLRYAIDDLKTYNQWANGDVYSFTLLNDNGEVVDSCSGFYGIDDIKDHLPDEFKNENLEDYIKY